ncbi:hypothetical protein FACS189450_01780 [Spirochaetia bacterium]|nr:hypothetical protein FACS189450_01780 [Spirochaetia bacterium]
MYKKTGISIILSLLPLFMALSCTYKGEVNFPARGMNRPLYAASRAAAAGILNTANPKKLEYRFGSPFFVPSSSSLELEYSFSDDAPGSGPALAEIKKNYQLVLYISGGNSWVLPWDESFLGNGELTESSAPYRGAGPRFHYAVPLFGDSIESFSIEMIPVASGVKKKPPQLTWNLRELRLVTQWYGLVRERNGAFHATPFVYYIPGSGQLGIDPPFRFRFAGGVDLAAGITEFSIVPSGGGRGLKKITAELGGIRFETGLDREELFISEGNFSAEPYPVKVEIPGIGTSLTRPDTFLADEAAAFTVKLLPAEERKFPNPIPADPGLILAYPQENWRKPDYEVFRWESFPSLLIFDTADYAVQDRLLKRLAFFVEKQGYTGRLATDAEIADQHGWNAHDYRSEDLARFFEVARAINFPLLKEEHELERILLDADIIRRSGSSIVSGEGGIVSISRESPDYLRTLFMVHESFHGLFFIDADFREFSRRRWEKLDPASKRFILSYFDYQHYNIKDEYLVLNEFMAHCLQQSVGQAPRYFGETLASRIDASPWRRAVLPQKDEASGAWPAIAEAFRQEAEAFSAYVNGRWGLAAGRVRQITVSGK